MNKPKPLRTESFEKTCLFFDDLQTMMISLSSLILISDVLYRKACPFIDLTDDEKLDKLVEIPFEGLTIKEAYSYKAFKPLSGIVKNTPTEVVEFNIYPPLPVGTSVKTISDSHYVDQPTLFQQRIIGSAFVNFFERNKSTIETKFGQNPSSWPPELNFARVIRNAYSHGGQIHFTSPSASPVTWRGIRYSYSDNGKSIHDKIYLPEIIELMKEIEKQIT